MKRSGPIMDPCGSVILNNKNMNILSFKDIL